MSITTGERGVLERMGDGYWTAKQLADELKRSYGSVHAMLVSLEKKGYVRATSDGSTVSYTQTGRGGEAAKEPRLIIGPERAKKLERHLKEVVGIANPSRFVRNYCQWPVESLAELNQDQGRELISLATKYVARAEQQKAAEAERDRKKQLGAEGVYRG